MFLDAIAATKLSDVLKPQAVGEPVNVHVVQPAIEPQPDFESMQRLVSGQVPTDQREQQRERKE